MCGDSPQQGDAKTAERLPKRGCRRFDGWSWNNNLIEAFILGAAVHVNVEESWDDDLMKQLRPPGPIQDR